MSATPSKAAAPSGSAVPSPDRLGTPPSSTPAPPRILVIDDVQAIHDDFEKILTEAESPTADALEALHEALFEEATKAPRRSSFLLEHAFQGQEGLAAVQRALAENRPFALAFVDIRMPPGWDGVETIAHLWAADPRLQIVICSAYSDYTWENLRARFGDTESLLILKKPFDTIEVLQLAHMLTRKWQLAQAREARPAHSVP